MMPIFMQTLINSENDIYELLLNTSMYEFDVDNIHYSNYIIFKDNFDIYYRVFIHNGLLGNDIDFFIDSFNTDNKLILLAYEKDLPMLILMDDNEQNSDKFNNYIFRNVGKVTEVLSTEENTIEDIDILIETQDKVFNYNIVSLKYDSIKNVYFNTYIDDNNEQRIEYEIYNKDNSQVKKVLRHYKLIQKKFNEQEISQYSIPTKNQNTIEYVQYDIKFLSQNPNNYNANIYQDEGLNVHNEFRDNTLIFTRYYSVEDLQNKLKDNANLAAFNYANKLNKDYVVEEDFISSVQECFNNYDSNNYMYFRLAPSLDMRVSQYERVLKINRIYTDYEDDEYVHQLAEEGQIPIFNDNLIYSMNKYKYINQNIEKEQIRNLGN